MAIFAIAVCAFLGFGSTVLIPTSAYAATTPTTSKSATDTAPSSVSHGKQTAGSIDIWFAPEQPTTSQEVLVTGVIGDSGTVIIVNSAGKVDKNGSYEKWQFRDGTILLNIAQYNYAIKHHTVPNTYSPTNCSMFIADVALEPIVNGTGKYSGATGMISVAARNGYLFQRKSNGDCNLNRGVFKERLTLVIATGYIKF